MIKAAREMTTTSSADDSDYVVASIDRIEVPVPETTITECEGICWWWNRAAEKMWGLKVWRNDPQHEAWFSDAFTIATLEG